MKWLTDAGRHRAVVAALARALLLLGLQRYAALCLSDTTTEVLAAYERSAAEGKKAFRTADLRSGIRPPGIPELEWGALMGVTESQALSSTAELLELAVAGGELVPGGRGWKQRQQELVRQHLTMPRIDLGGRTWLDCIRAERLEAWLEDHRSPTRRQVLETIVGQLRSPPMLPEGTDDAVPPLRWFLAQLVDGQPLTPSGNLTRALVHEAAGRFGWWVFDKPPRSEGELFDLRQVRDLAQRLGLARPSGRRLVLTPKGRAGLADDDQLWRLAARGLLRDHPFAAALGEMTLAVLVSRDSTPTAELDELLGAIVGEVGWRDSHTGAPPNEHDISWARHQTTNLLRALTLLSSGAHWLDRAYGLTAPGRAIALECLHHRAMGPRATPWG